MDSGRGSVAYSSGRRPEASPHDTSADSDAVASRVQPQPGPSQQVAGPSKNLRKCISLLKINRAIRNPSMFLVASAILPVSWFHLCQVDLKRTIDIISIRNGL